MKILVVAITVLLSFSQAKATASDDTQVSKEVLASFHSSFKNVTDLAWKISGNFYKADFAMSGQYITAYYDANARLAAVTRNISTLQLPVVLQTALKNSYQDHWVSDLFELSDDSGTCYYVTIENGPSKIILKSASSNNWELFEKRSKL